MLIHIRKLLKDTERTKEGTEHTESERRNFSICNYAGNPLPGRLLRKKDYSNLPFPEDVYTGSE